MVGNIGSTSNLINVITSSYQQSNLISQGGVPEAFSMPPQGPPPGQGDMPKPDPLGVFDTVDSDDNGTISESEYSILTEGILEITGSANIQNFLTLDTDGDGQITGSELKVALDDAGFAPPPPPPQKVITAYEAQQSENDTFQTDDESLLQQLLEYLENRDNEFDIMA